LKIDFAPKGPVDPKFQAEGVAPTNHSSSPKTRFNDFSYDIKIWTDISSILSQSTRLTDGQTDRQRDSFLIAIPRLHSMQRGKKTAKIKYTNTKLHSASQSYISHRSKTAKMKIL